MKIAILSPFYPYRGGLAQLNARLYTELGRNNEVRAFSFTTLYPEFLFPGQTQFVTEDDDVTVIENKRVLNTINPFSYIKTAKEINRFSPDVLIIPYWMSYLAPAFGSVARLVKKKTKIVSLVHNVVSHEKNIIDRPLSKYFLSSCDAFITMSDTVCEELKLFQNNHNILMQPHPIYDHYEEKSDRNAACDSLGIDKDKKNMLFFGFIREYKGLDALIEAFGNLDKSYQLIIAGEVYGSFDIYQELINKSANTENIKVFNEYITDKKVSQFFSASDVLILPYRSGTQSGVIGIAYQLSTPIITTDVGELGKTVRQAQTGVVVESADANLIASGIEEFFELDKTVLLENLQKEKTRLSWSNFAHSVESFISNL